MYLLNKDLRWFTFLPVSKYYCRRAGEVPLSLSGECFKLKFTVIFLPVADHWSSKVRRAPIALQITVTSYRVVYCPNKLLPSSVGPHASTQASRD
jgi:hypothetical protein